MIEVVVEQYKELTKWSDSAYYMTAVLSNAVLLRYVVNQINEICLAVVKQNVLALEYAIDQTEKIHQAAVAETDLALKYVDIKFPTVKAVIGTSEQKSSY